MADAVQVNTLFDGSRRKIIQLINLSDGTGESAVVKADISADANTPTKYSIQEVEFDVQGFTSVAINFDATTDDEGLLLTGNGYKDFSGAGGLHDPQSTGYTGDIVLTTQGAAANASYDIILHLKKHY